MGSREPVAWEMEIERGWRIRNNEEKRIEHRVTRLDTLAGVAIKYGVEVADIKRMNGLVTDLQMFAHKKLQIPLPGRHPPSPNNGHHIPHKSHMDGLESYRSLGLKPPTRKVSPAMSKLQGYYGLAPKMDCVIDGTEMSVYPNHRTLDPEGTASQRVFPCAEQHLGHHKKSRSFGNGFFMGRLGLGEDEVTDSSDYMESDRYQSEKIMRRRQKIETDPPQTPQTLICNGNTGSFSGRPTKSLAPRPKSVSRADQDVAHSIAISFGDSLVADGYSSVRKSSSTSNLQESDVSSFWPTARRNPKAEVTSRLTFDGFPKPLMPRKNKAAID